MKTKSKLAMAILSVLAILILLAYLPPARAPPSSVDQDFYGWRMSARTPAYPNWPGDWVKGDLGKNWKELDWVSYVLVLNGYGGTTLPAFDIQFDFYISTKDAVFVDLVRNFYYKIRDPYPGSGKPNDVAPANFATTWTGTAFTPTIINRPFPEGTADSQTNPPLFSFWRLTPNPAPGLANPIPAGKSVVIYFEARLAPSFVWMNGKEYLFNQAPTNAWGGDRYGPPYSANWTATHFGSGYTSGSNPQFRLSGEGVGQKTVPIPIPPAPVGEIRGTKYHDLNANGVMDAGEPGLGGWTINLEAIIQGIPFPLTTTTAGDGSYAFTDLPAATYTISEVPQPPYWIQTAPTPVPPGEHEVILGEGEIVTGKDFGNFQYTDLTVSKDVTPYWRQNITWTITKTATPELSEIFVGDKTDVKYTISVNAAPTADYYKVSGTITVNNPNPAAVPVYATILDEVMDGTVVKGFQDLTPVGPIPHGVSTYPYSIELPGIGAGTYINNVTVTVTAPISETYYWEEPFSFTTPTEYVDDEVDVEDSYEGYLGTVSYFDPLPKTFEYTRTFGPYAVTGIHPYDNTATATGKDTLTEWTDDASVTIKVYDITVSKTADTYWKKVFEWSIDKSVEAAQLNPFINDQIEVKYTISVVKSLYSQTFNVSGTITITNLNPAKDAVVYVVDKIYDGATVVYTLDLGGPYTVVYGTPLTIDYEITLPFDATPDHTYTNKAHVKLNNYHWNYTGVPIGGSIGQTEFTGSETFYYDEPDEKINDEVTVTDEQIIPAGKLELISSDYPLGPPEGWTTDKSDTFVINKVIKALEVGTWDLEDQASAAGDTLTWYSDWKTLTFTVYDIEVLKTATPWWTRTYNWTIDKSVDPTELVLYDGETGTVTYTITITKIEVGNVYKVNGTITITNLNPEKDAIVYVVDKIFDGLTELYSLDLGGPYTVVYGTPLTIDYEIELPFTPVVLKTYTNVAYVNLTNYLWKLSAPKEELPYITKFMGDDDFTFTTPTKIIDDSATVTEDETVPPEFIALVWDSSHGDPPWLVTDSTIITFKKNITEVSATPCNWYDLPNTVTLTESDTLEVRTDDALVQIHVVQPYAGTIGYWMNHPDAWVDTGISPDDPFPWTTGDVAGFSYMQILETEPAGDRSIQLARQYIGAKLNMLKWGVPSEIEAKIAEAEAFFGGVPPSPFAPDAYPAGSNPESSTDAFHYANELADILEAYNSGKPPYDWVLPPP